MAGGGGGLRAALRRVFSSTEELESDELRRQCRDAGAKPVADCSPRQRVVLRGTISSVIVGRSSAGHGLEAELNDGSGKVRLVWMGREQIQGLTAGRVVKVSGRLCEHDGDLVMFNPGYELLN